MMAAYGDVGDLARLCRGLETTAKAFNDGDLPRAMVAALHLGLPEADAAAAGRVARVAAFLAKYNYNPAQLRDWHGRWTAEAASGGGPPRVPHDASSPGGETRPGRPSALLTPILDQAEAEPPPDDVPDEDPEEEEESRRSDPRLPNGEPWPVAYPDVLRRILSRPLDRSLPRTPVLVPADGVGPPLLAATETQEFTSMPPGYRRVEFYGTPQETRSGGAYTNHAPDGVEQGLEEAIHNPAVTEVWFNRAPATVTRGEVVLPVRPDVTVVYDRSMLAPGVAPFAPFESFSPGQDPDARARQLQHPLLEPLRGRFYKKFLRLLLALWRRVRGA